MGNPVISRDAANALQLGKNGSYSNEGNVIQHVLYDNMDFQATTFRAETVFFSVPIGGAYMGVNKTIIETNMREVGKLPNGQTFLVQGISFALIPMFAGADIDVNTINAAYIILMQNSTCEFKIEGREYDSQMPGSTFLCPMQSAALNSAINGAPFQGAYLSSGWLNFPATPIPIGQMVTFSVIMRTGSAVAAISAIMNDKSNVLDAQEAQMQCRLRGILTRAI